MIIHECEQRTDAWHALRIGRITGTRLRELAGGKPPTVETLCLKIAAEKLTGVSAEKPFKVTPAMEHGIDTEDEARREYELETMSHVREVGFIEKDELFGVSPDGLIDDDGLVEIKCPMAATHLGYWLKHNNCGAAWKSYKHQIQGQLWVSGRDWCDFVSYQPDFPADKRILIERVERDADYHEMLDKKSELARKRISEILGALSEAG